MLLLQHSVALFILIHLARKPFVTNCSSWLCIFFSLTLD